MLIACINNPGPPANSELKHGGGGVVAPYDNFFFLVLIVSLKGTVCVISSDILCEDGYSRFTAVPLKPVSGQVHAMGKLEEINTFPI